MVFVPSFAQTVLGSVAVKRLPSSGLFSAVTVPPCALTRDLTMARPIPAPPVPLLRDLSAR